MKICMISPYPPQTGGVPVHAESLVKHLSRKHEVTLITYGKFGRRSSGNLEVHEIPVINIKFLRGLSFYMGALFKLRSLCKKGNFDVIHAQYMHPPGTVAAKYKWLARRKGKVLVTAHGSDLLSMASGRLGRWLVRWVGNHVNGVICVSDYLGGQAKELGVKSVKVVCNGIDDHDLPKSGKGVLRKKLGLPEKKIITFSGKLTQAKGSDIFLILAEQLVHRRRDLLFVVVGGGPERKDLERFVEKKGLSDYVTFTGAKEHGEALEYMKASDVVVVPSRIEGFGLTALEAACMGVPVVASNSCALPEILSGHSVTENMPHTVLKVLESRKFRDGIVRENRKICKKFTLERMCDETEKLYKSGKRS